MATPASGGAARFVQCAAKNQYDHVPAAERCSIGVAQRIGVYDPDQWYQDPFSATTKTKSEDPVAMTSDGTKPSVLCSASAAAPTTAFPLCGVAVGLESKREEAPNGTATCVTSECPPGYTLEGDTCVKPTLPRRVPQTERCDQRWYDWFNIENAHLGNGVASGADGTCFAPCPAGFVPNLNTNPADGSLINVTGSDDPSQCVPKSDFAFAVYARSPDYAPLAWIHRLTTRPEDFIGRTEAAVDGLSADGSTKVTDGARTAASKNASAQAGEIYTAMDTVTNDLLDASTATASGGSAAPAISTGTRYLGAAKSINTADRLQYAHDVCVQVRDNPDAFLKKWGAAWGSRAAQRMAVLRQACHLTCCDDNNMAAIGQKPICFDAATLRNGGKDAAAAKAAQAADAKAAKAKVAQEASDQKLRDSGVGSPGELAFYRSMRTVILLAVLPVLIVILWVTLLPLLTFIWRTLVTGWDPKLNGLQNQQAATLRADGRKAWLDRAGQVLGSVAGAVRWVVGGVAPVAVSAVGNVGKEVTHGLLGKSLAGLSVLLVVVLAFAAAMFIYFYVRVYDIRFGKSGGFYTGLEAFLNAFNYHDWSIFNVQEWWPVRVANEFLNPYRRLVSPEAIARPVIPAGRCDNVSWVGDGASACAASVLPQPITWSVGFPEGGAVPGVLRAGAPASVSIPYVEDGDRFTASCDVQVEVPDGKGGTRRQALLAPSPGDPNSCARVRTALPAFADGLRPKRGSSGWAGLDAYADEATPRC